MFKKYSKKIIAFVILFVISSQLIFASEAIVKVHSDSVIAIDGDNGSILYGKNIDEKVYPASTTKILTAILAIENLNLEDAVVVSKTAVQLPSGSSHVGLKQGEVISVNDLLYCLMLNSGNDAANVLAEAVSGSIKDFVLLMNKKALELGCLNTNFANAHGYHDPNHYTTSNDMMKILSYATKNNTFKQITSTKTYIVDSTNVNKNERLLKNTNRLILTKEDSSFARFYEYAIGGKTGYTPEAKRTLVAYGQKDDKFVLVGIFGAAVGNGEDVRYTDAITLFEHAFNNFNRSLFANKEDYLFSYINFETKLKYTFCIPNDLYLMTNTNNKLQISYNIKIDEPLLNNITSIDDNTNNKVVGKIYFNITDLDKQFTPYNDLTLIAIEKITSFSNSILPTIFIALLALLFISVITLVIILVKIKFRKRKKVVKNASSNTSRIRRRQLNKKLK